MGIFPKIMNEILRFSTNSVYSLRSGIQLEKPSINTVQFGGESMVYLGAKIWEVIPENIKSPESVDIFKSKIKKWEIYNTRNLSTPTIQDIGFVN